MGNSMYVLYSNAKFLGLVISGLIVEVVLFVRWS